MGRSAARTLLALLPFLGWAFMFRCYGWLRTLTTLDQLAPPSLALPHYEQAVFGCLPHAVLAQHTHPALDLLAAVPYLFHYVLPAAYVAFLHRTRRRRGHILGYVWFFGCVNCVGLVVNLLAPSAPPWYNDTAVFDEAGGLVSVGPSEAGFARVDRLLSISLFARIYNASTVKFGAMPSLHAAWPSTILVNGPWVGRRVGLFHVLWISWAAVYTAHHYLIDVVAGILLVFGVHLAIVRGIAPFPASSEFFAAPPEPEEGTLLPQRAARQHGEARP